MEKIIEKIVCKMFGKHIVRNGQKDIYVYAMTLIITTLMGVLSIIGISAAFFSVFDGILFLVVFSFIRTFAGGYHCKNYISCFLVSNMIFLLVVAASFVGITLFATWAIGIDSLLILISWLYIFCNAPVVPITHLLSQKKVAKNRKRARFFSTIVSLCAFAGLIFFHNSSIVLYYFTIFALTQTSIAVLMLIEKIERRKKMLEIIETLLESIANLGAGSASLLLTYQPKTPKCLLDEEE